MRNIALCMELSDHYEHGIARGLVRYAKSKAEWRLYGYGWMFRPLADLSSWAGDGIIARVEDTETADTLSALGLPVVDVAGAYTRPHFRGVTNDDFLTGYKAAIHLIDCGFSRFAFLGVSGTLWSGQRKAGFEKCLAQRGVGDRAAASVGDRAAASVGDRAAVPALPSFERPLAWWESRPVGDRAADHPAGDRAADHPAGDRAAANPAGDRAAPPDLGDLEAFLLSLEAPTALFACNDTTGLRATELAGRVGLAVPESLAILGVDNEDILCELASPSLSSIMLDCEAIGFRAAAALDAILEGNPAAGIAGSGSVPGVPGAGLPEGARIEVPPKEVVERESTRIFACTDPLVARAVTFIRARAHEGIDVSDVLAVASASRRSLETRFRAQMGRSLHEEILRAKLARAKRLLRDTDTTIDRIADESGFGAPGRFHTAFREAEGMTPGEWRRKGG
jgi:LacI family transcriptional regulator